MGEIIYEFLENAYERCPKITGMIITLPLAEVLKKCSNL